LRAAPRKRRGRVEKVGRRGWDLCLGEEDGIVRAWEDAEVEGKGG
jgi:hypothetical protein